MKKVCTATAAQLVAGLKKVTPALKSSSVIPVIEMVHVTIANNVLVLTATDLSTSITTGIKASETVPGKFLLPKQAMAIVSNLPADTPVSIYADDKDRSFIKLEAGEISAKLPSDNPDTFPKSDEVETPTFSFDISEPEPFRGVLSVASTFTSADDMRPAMTGVLLTNKAIAATDAHRLVAVTMKLSDKEFSVILHKGAIAALASLESKKPWTIKGNENIIIITDKFTKITSRLINERFPDYNVVVPKETKFAVEFDKSALLKNLTIAESCTNKTTKQIIISMQDGRYSLGGEDADYNQQAITKGTCTYNDPAEYKFAVNGKFLREVVNLLDGETVSINMIDPTKCLIFRDGSYLFLMMPLMLK